MLAKHALSQLSYGPLGTAQGAMLSCSLGCLSRSKLATSLSKAKPSQAEEAPALMRRTPNEDGGPGTTRTSDLTLIRGAL